MLGGSSSGVEMLLRSMGLADVIDTAKKLAADGSLQRILKFADDLERHTKMLEEINGRLAALETGTIYSPPEPGAGQPRLGNGSGYSPELANPDGSN